MERASTTTEIGQMSELARLAHEVAESGEPRLLTENGETIAVLSPAPKPATPRKRRPRPKREGREAPEDTILSIIGMFDDPDGPTDVSTNKHKYLAEAYMPKTK